jgi:anti-sigma factor (TIGR02949 family)
MECKTARDMLPLYFDGELDRAASSQFETHLDACAACRAELENLDGLRSSLRRAAPRVAAPQTLRERIQKEVRRELAPPRGRPAQRWLALAASWVLAFGAGATLVPRLIHTSEENIPRDLFASHWRALAASSPVDVVSTDRHTVKPWFAGRIAQAPLVQDFAAEGFALVGGRIDYAGSERVAVLVYRHGQHLIDVFLLPGTHNGAVSATQRQGYWLQPVQLGGQAAAMVSDMDATEREHLAQLLEAAK